MFIDFKQRFDNKEPLEEVRYAAKAVILRNPNDPEVLFLEHENGMLLLPGGAIEPSDFDNLFSAFQDSPQIYELWAVAFDREMKEEGVPNLIPYDHDFADNIFVGCPWVKNGRVCFDYATPIWLDEQTEFEVSPRNEIIGSRWISKKDFYNYRDENTQDNTHIPRNIWALVDMGLTAEEMGYDQYYSEITKGLQVL